MHWYEEIHLNQSLSTRDTSNRLGNIHPPLRATCEKTKLIVIVHSMLLILEWGFECVRISKEFQVTTTSTDDLKSLFPDLFLCDRWSRGEVDWQWHCAHFFLCPDCNIVCVDVVVRKLKRVKYLFCIQSKSCFVFRQLWLSAIDPHWFFYLKPSKSI